jgi:hypothetical protein
MQSPVPGTSRNHAWLEPDFEKLPIRDHPVLLSGNLGETYFGLVEFLSHSDNKSPSAANSPP